MSKNKYRISKQAIEDLEKIWVYTLNRWSKKQADRYYNLIIGEIEFIADNFMTGKSAEQTRKNYSIRVASMVKEPLNTILDQKRKLGLN